MKKITNWANASVADLESDGLLDEATKIHVLSFKLSDKTIKSIEGDNKERLIAFFKYHIDNNIPIVMHNGICFDVPLAEEILGIDLSNLMVIDTLAVSWYLNIERQKHGLDSFLEDYGIAKPKIDDWENLTYEEYKFRCETDVEINYELWEDLKDRLIDMYERVKLAVDIGDVDGKRVEGEVCHIDQYKQSSSVEDYIDRILQFLCHKMDISRLKEKTRFKADEEAIDAGIAELEGFIDAAAKELESVMPQVPKYTKKNKPKDCYKKNGELSVSGSNWEAALAKIGQKDDDGNELVIVVSDIELKVLNKYEPPNINGSQQIKDFLFSKGWVPETFKYDIKDSDKTAWVESGYKKHLKPVPRKIPQINRDGDDGKELCPSVLRLAEVVPEIMAYAKYSVIKHRYGVLKGFKRDLSEDGFLVARNGGFTNTLREKHRELVNLVSVSKPFGKYIRGSLISEKGKILCGSDMSSLEDRIKHNFMIPHDPEYVEIMSVKGYDPHLQLAVLAGLLSPAEEARYKELKKRDDLSPEEKAEFTKLGIIRQTGKGGNYACQYGSGAETLSRQSKIPLATAKKVVEGYKQMNWSIEAIADDQCVITDARGLKWLINPINGFCYNIRSNKDRFSTLCQGTGSFMFDMWVDRFLEKMKEKWSVKRLSGQFHDELVVSFRDTEENKLAVKEMLNAAVEEVNTTFMLRKKLGCDVQFGTRYSEIH